MQPTLPFGGLHLGSLPLLCNHETRSICAENPTGERAGGAKADPQGVGPARKLGVGWKVRPAIDLEPNSTVTIADITGPAVIQHIWITVDRARWRDLMLRMYWDGEDTPSVEVPLGDFFACGHNVATQINSLPIAVNPYGGFNSYWQMPFRKGAKITITNDHHELIRGFFYQITYSLQDVPAEAGYFHAQWRRSQTTREYPEHVLLDGVKGAGHYVGTYIAWSQFSDGWWGEGEIKFYMDGDKQHPTICGTGTEDYFGGAWGFAGPDQHEQTFSTPFLGMPLVQHETNRVPKYGLYRWHVLDPIRFQKDLRVTMQALGWWLGGGVLFQPLTDDLASTAYWYQSEPHAPFPALLERDLRIPR